MKRSELKRFRSCKECGNAIGMQGVTGLCRSCNCKRIAATGAGGRAHAMLPPDAPLNKYGTRCVEMPCLICGEEFLTPLSGLSVRKTCSRRCAALLKRGRGGANRQGEANPNYKSGSRMGVRDRAGEARWYPALKDKCEAPWCENTQNLVLHHIYYRQHIRLEQGDIWDPRNALTLCPTCHARHHQRTKKIPLDVLPLSAWQFAVELVGKERAADYMERYYESQADFS